MEDEDLNIQIKQSMQWIADLVSSDPQGEHLNSSLHETLDWFDELTQDKGETMNVTLEPLGGTASGSSIDSGDPSSHVSTPCCETLTSSSGDNNSSKHSDLNSLLEETLDWFEEITQHKEENKTSNIKQETFSCENLLKQEIDNGGFYTPCLGENLKLTSNLHIGKAMGTIEMPEVSVSSMVSEDPSLHSSNSYCEASPTVSRDVVSNECSGIPLLHSSVHYWELSPLNSLHETSGVPALNYTFPHSEVLPLNTQVDVRSWVNSIPPLRPILPYLGVDSSNSQENVSSKVNSIPPLIPILPYLGGDSSNSKENASSMLTSISPLRPILPYLGAVSTNSQENVSSMFSGIPPLSCPFPQWEVFSSNSEGEVSSMFSGIPPLGFSFPPYGVSSSNLQDADSSMLRGIPPYSPVLPLQPPIRHTMKTLACDICFREFTSPYHLNVHNKTHSKSKILQRNLICEICPNKPHFTYRQNLRRHKKKFHPTTECLLCEYCGKDKQFSGECTCYTSLQQQTLKYATVNQSGAGIGEERDLNSEVVKHSILCVGCHKRFEKAPGDKTLRCEQCTQNRGKTSKTTNLQCHKCNILCKNKSEMYEHSLKLHQNTDNLQIPVWEKEDRLPPWEGPSGEVDLELKKMYEMHSSLILKPNKIGIHQSVFNTSIDNSLSIEEITKQIRDIYASQPQAFKINLAFGFILKDVETKAYRMFKAYNNQTVLKVPFLVSSQTDILKFEGEMKQLDIINHILLQRPNSKFKPTLLTNMLITINPTAYLVGSSNITLPAYIKQNKSILGLDRTIISKPLKEGDNLCMFRCLTAHLHPELYAKRLSGEFETKTRHYLSKWFEFGNMGLLEDEYEGFDLNDIPKLEQCFKLNINIFSLSEDHSSSNIYSSFSTFEDTMNLNLFQNHVSYIHNMSTFCQKFQCVHCERFFKKKCDWNKHLKSCEGKLKLVYPGGFFKPQKTIFDELESHGIEVPLQERYFKHFLVFDMEAMLIPISESNSEKLVWTHNHHPISVAVCSNHEEYSEPVCFINPDLEKLIQEMVEYMEEISTSISKIYIEKFEDVFKEIDCLSSHWANNKIMQNQISRLKKNFSRYCMQVPVLGFNSARYDLNLIKSRIIKHLKLESCTESFVIKKNNSYSCISTESFRFLDITHYLSPGTSYVSFLKAFEVEEVKGFFPYEYFSSEDKLLETRLPPLEGSAWWSTLKNKSVLEDGVKTIEENYAWLLEIWEKENMQTFSDFLRWYNCLDVSPFVTGVNKLCEFYFEKGVDIFKESISVPGVARKLAFEEARKSKATFALVNDKNKDLYDSIEANLVGGPSIIFTRHHKVEETFIRSNENFICKKIIGFDANALYLWAFNQNMPVGYFIMRKAETGFKPEKNVKYSSMFHWMDWVSLTRKVDIQHYRNSGEEKRIGPYLVDGFDEKNNTVYQFHGCFFHGHDCYLNKKNMSAETRKLLKKRQMDTEKNREFLKEHNYELVEVYECQFLEECSLDPQLRKFVTEQHPRFYQMNRSEVTQDEIISGVLKDELFGMIEVDISVPESWEEVDFCLSPSQTPFEYFKEMCPLFGNAEITYEDMGEHMKNHIRKNNLGEKPRRLLVGVMKAKQMLIATPLLKWYIKHGMKITKIYQVIEFNSSPCFNGFVSRVSDARRLGDEDPSKSVLADTMKLIGNSAFGSMIMNKKKHRKIYYVEDHKEVAKAINDPSFERLEEICADYYEIQAFKNRIILDLPTQIGFFILQYGKLRMLEFYFDFMDRFIDRTNFEYCEMDTDSAYMAISEDALEKIIKPEFREEYNKMRVGFCGERKFEADNDLHWFPRECCEFHRKYDKRTPGLFKIEFEGDEIVGLCSKTYIVTDGDNYKFSSKGINKQRVQDPLQIFKRVLETGKKEGGENIGFRVRNQGISTYSMKRDGFSYLYCKRKLMQDGNNTEPLDISLQPNKKPKPSILNSF